MKIFENKIKFGGKKVSNKMKILKYRTTVTILMAKNTTKNQNKKV